VVTKALALVLLLASVDAGEVYLDTPEITKEDVWQYRKTRFLQLSNTMAENVPELKCRSLLNQEQETAFFECSSETRSFGALFVWHNGEWEKAPGIYAD
jgi:hypothetical protein